MGMLIFLAAFFVEIAFAAFCIFSKSYHPTVRSKIRIASFAFFLLLAALPVIDWGLRYYSLAALLLLLSLVGAKKLIQIKEEREFKAARVILKASGMIVLTFIVALPAMVFPQDKAVVKATGEYQVSTVVYSYIDTNRVESYRDTGAARKLNVQWWYPDQTDGTNPLVVYSHGGLGIKSGNESLFMELASHGYIVCSIDHTYQCLYTTDDDGDMTFIDSGYMRELFAEDAQADIQQSFVYYQKWMQVRTEDINFVIDHIIDESDNNKADAVYKLVDTDRIGVIGHSLGGSAALGIGRFREDVGAVIALESPFMCDIERVADGRFIFTDTVYPVPVLNVYSDSSWSILGERPQYAANYKLLSDSDATAFNIHIRGVGHLALTDFGLTSPFLTRVLDREKSGIDQIMFSLNTINKNCLAFFNDYLKDEGNYAPAGMPE